MEVEEVEEEQNSYTDIQLEGSGDSPVKSIQNHPNSSPSGTNKVK